MQVEDDHAEDDGAGDQDHGEHDVVDDNRDAQRGLWDFISQQQQEDGEGQQNVDGQTHLLTWNKKRSCYSRYGLTLSGVRDDTVSVNENEKPNQPKISFSVKIFKDLSKSY